MQAIHNQRPRPTLSDCHLVGSAASRSQSTSACRWNNRSSDTRRRSPPAPSNRQHTNPKRQRGVSATGAWRSPFSPRERAGVRATAAHFRTPRERDRLLPLPRGRARVRATAADFRTPQERDRRLPLPTGEGRGEGDRGRKPRATESRREVGRVFACCLNSRCAMRFSRVDNPQCRFHAGDRRAAARGVALVAASGALRGPLVPPGGGGAAAARGGTG